MKAIFTIITVLCIANVQAMELITNVDDSLAVGAPSPTEGTLPPPVGTPPPTGSTEPVITIPVRLCGGFISSPLCQDNPPGTPGGLGGELTIHFRGVSDCGRSDSATGGPGETVTSLRSCKGNGFLVLPESVRSGNNKPSTGAVITGTLVFSPTL